MAYIDRMDGQDYIDKTRAYLDYVEEHLENVRQAFIIVSNACEGKMMWAGLDSAWMPFMAEVKAHDLSKFSPEEFVQYRANFYPVNDEDKASSGFDEAWENHKRENAHHHEVLRNYMDVVHMVIDWTAMGFKFGDTAQEYYEANQGRIKLSDEHKKFMYEIFECIAEYTKKNPLT